MNRATAGRIHLAKPRPPGWFGLGMGDHGLDLGWAMGHGRGGCTSDPIG